MIEVEIGNRLRELKSTLATAESCTGGLIAHRLTNISGSSDYIVGGIVSYANSVKINILKVSPKTIDTYGAVSEQTVREMAEGARKLLGADIAVSVSGIAGPMGGSADKPVGTTWVGLSTSKGLWARHFIWQGDREQNKNQSADAALELVFDYLNGKLK